MAMHGMSPSMMHGPPGGMGGMNPQLGPSQQPPYNSAQTQYRQSMLDAHKAGVPPGGPGSAQSQMHMRGPPMPANRLPGQLGPPPPQPGQQLGQPPKLSMGGPMHPPGQPGLGGPPKPGGGKDGDGEPGSASQPPTPAALLGNAPAGLQRPPTAPASVPPPPSSGPAPGGMPELGFDFDTGDFDFGANPMDDFTWFDPPEP
ncbi:hypothetical protein BC834DRAFT_966760 [Gloeopeniophorella convolvens]|nr:hypothetical protein BC834DRAFT_966760 [Gloeopeniophorella convolvens]